MENFVYIEQEVPLTIFDEPTVVKKKDKLFDDAEQKIKARVNEIVTFLGRDSTDELSYENIVNLFEGYFYEMILNEAIEMTFLGQGQYNILSNVLALLTEEKIEIAIMGEPMIDAFSDAIRSMPATSAFASARKGSKILLLEKEFLGKSVLSEFISEKGQSNYCGDCGCFCTCDGGCNGDIEKCTSKEAVEKGCNHHCNCFIDPMVEKFPKVN